tara:strand:+ start:90 stop:773 length:684 start_codon:yes stop_codon:yes gene_type:complete
MKNNSKEKIYSSAHFPFIEKIALNKRIEMTEKIKDFLKNKDIQNVLDVGTTEDNELASSNFIIKNLGNYNNYKSISDQNIESNFFSKTLKKSITDDFSDEEIKDFQSDLVISNATIEHVGSFENQTKMCSNIIKLSKKYFIILTPNRFHPFEFHTKLPLIHWFPKKFYRAILRFIGLKFFAEEKNLNLCSENDLRLMMKITKNSDFKIDKINFFYLRSNLILLGTKA